MSNSNTTANLNTNVKLTRDASGCFYVGDSCIANKITTSNTSTNSWASAASNYIYSNSPYVVTTATNGWSFDVDQLYDTFVQVLSEAEIKDLVDKVKERQPDKTKTKSFISNIVKRRHFSEAFLIENIEYLTKADIYVHHEGDVQSNEYSELALYLKMNND